jgi:hypothetical protein
VKDVTDCSEVEIVRVDSRLVNGSFYLTQSMLNNRPVYEHESQPELRLFHYHSPDCSFWALGGSASSDDTVLYAYDVSLSPEKVIGSFTAYESSQWTVDNPSTISIKCITPLA